MHQHRLPSPVPTSAVINFKTGEYDVYYEGNYRLEHKLQPETYKLYECRRLIAEADNRYFAGAVMSADTSAWTPDKLQQFVEVAAERVGSRNQAMRTGSPVWR